MAVNKEKLFDGIQNGAVWDTGVVFNRTNGIPIDKWSVFKTLAEAETYASSNPVAYPGQFIAVVNDDGSAVGYMIQPDGTLKIVGADVSEVLKYTEQTLTEEQKLQARTNIGACESVSLTQEEYDKLREDGNISLTTYYYIYEET